MLRIVHDDDPVPLLPPLIIDGGGLSSYGHCWPEVILHTDGHFYYPPTQKLAQERAAQDSPDP